MPNVIITLQGRVYTIACDDGQERRVQQLALYVDQKLRDISRSGAAVSEQYQFVLGSLMLADEVLSAREQLDELQTNPTFNQETLQKASEKASRQTEVDVAAVQHLTSRLEQLATKLQDTDA
jgi:cell division protein ZapA